MRNAWAIAYLLPTSAWFVVLRDEEMALTTTYTVTGSDSDMVIMLNVTSAKLRVEIGQLNAFALRVVQACQSPTLFENWLVLCGVDS